jgi:tetratricopeptide (TPR) repeat protein
VTGLKPNAVVLLDGSKQQGWAPRLVQEARLRQLVDLLAHQPATGDAIRTEIERAVLLGALDRRAEAQRAFIEILRRAPENFSALNEFGTLLTQMGAIEAACRVYAEAILHHPQNTMARVNLANLVLRVNRHAEARDQYEAVLRTDPDHAEAHRGLGAVLADIGDREGPAPFRAGFSRPRGLDFTLSRHQSAGNAAATCVVGRR